MRNPLHILRERAAYWVAAFADRIVGDDPDPQYSPLDRMDGRVQRDDMLAEMRLLGSLEDSQQGAIDLAKSELARGDADLAAAVLEGFVSREQVAR